MTRITSELKFVQSQPKLIKHQENDLEMVLIDQGAYRVQNAFNDIIASRGDWVKMTPNQRKRALQKVHAWDARSPGMTEKAEKILQVPEQVIPIPSSEGSLLIPSKTNAWTHTS